MKKTATENKTTRIEWVTKPEDAVIYDDAFWVKRQKWGTFVSVGADDLHIITSLTEEQCVKATRFYLQGCQEGWDDAPTHCGEVGGKL
jgi:hypothetical protein